MASTYSGQHKVPDDQPPDPSTNKIKHLACVASVYCIPFLSVVHQFLGLISTALFSAHGSDAVMVQEQNVWNSHQYVRDSWMDMSRDQKRQRERSVVRRKREKRLMTRKN